MATPTVGLTEVDKLILRAVEKGLTFPDGVRRWQLLAWAAEQLEARRVDPGRWERQGMAEIHARHFPPGQTAVS